MKRNILNKLTLLAVLILLASCKAKKPAPQPIIFTPQAQTKIDFSKVDVLKKMTDNQVKFNTLLIRAKADLNINNNSNDVSMNIRMQKDQIIWVSVTAIAGIEVARVLITPDSIKILNRVESSYTKKPFKYIYQFANSQVNFKTLQDLFVGNALAGTLSETSTVEINAGQTQIKGTLAALTFAHIFNANNKLIQSNLTDKKALQSLTLDYGEYANFDGQALPQMVFIRSVISGKNSSINLKYNHVGVNERVDFPFSVPKRFTVKN